MNQTLIHGHIFTEQAKRLNNALRTRGLDTEPEFWDGHKHIDIAIPSAHIYIEVDGNKHYTDADQIERDFKRNHYSDGDDFDTIHIPNLIILDHCEEVADAIASVAFRRTS
jgi:very-short-patch-repair endonuclease